MLNYSVEKYRLLLKNPFRIAHGVSEYRYTIIVTLKYEDFSGYGEAPVVPYFGMDPDSLEKEMEEFLRKESDKLARLFSKGTYDAGWDEDRLSELSPFSRSAITMAILDILAKEKALSFDAFMELESDTVGIETSYTVASTRKDEIFSGIEQSPSRIVKLKLGFENDISLLETLLDRWRNRIFRLDVNQGWTASDAHKNVSLLNEILKRFAGQYPVLQLLEEPVEKNWELIGEISRESDIPVFLDESVQRIDDLNALTEKNESGNCKVSGIVLKLAKNGGILETLKMIRKARKFGLKTMMGCYIESSLGVTVAAFLASQCDYADLDAPLLTANDPFSGLRYERGGRESVTLTLQLPGGYGYGVRRKVSI